MLNEEFKYPEGADSKSTTISLVTDAAKKGYHAAMTGYSNILDKASISPNQIVSGRVIAGIIFGLALTRDDLSLLNESLLLTGLGVSFYHDAVDGYHARNTQQTSVLGEKLDALGDKGLLFPLIIILLNSLDIDPTIMWTIIPLLGIAIGADTKSSLLRGDNIKAIKAGLDKPLTKEEREQNPNAKSKNAAVGAGKTKTAIMMGGVMLAYAHNVLGISDNSTGIIVAGTLASSNVMSILSLKEKGVTFGNLFQKK